MSNIITTNVSDIPIKDKQLLIDPKRGELYFDHNGSRVQLGGGNEEIDFPVDSVNGKSGAVVLNASDVGAIPSGGAVTEINGKVGSSVVLNADDVGAAPEMELVDLDAFNDGDKVLVDLEAGKYYKSFLDSGPESAYVIESVQESVRETIMELDTTVGPFSDAASQISVSFPDSVRWVTDPEFTPGHWIVSVVNSIAVAAEVSTDPLSVPLTFTAVEAASTVALDAIGTLTLPEIYYRMGRSGVWQPYTASQVITLISVGDTVQFWNSADTLSTGESSYARFAVSGKVKASGNVQSMLNWRSDVPAYGLSNLFANTEKLTDLPLFPATSIGERGYRYVARYSGASGHVSIAYSSGFGSCGFAFMESAITTLELLGTAKPINYQLHSAFSGCTNLSKIKVHFTEWDNVPDSCAGCFANVAANGTFYKPSALPEEYGATRIPEGWTVVNID